MHSDVVDLMESASHGGSKYFVTLYDDSSALSRARSPRSRMEFVSELRCIREGSAERIRFDSRGEYISRCFPDWLTDKGIRMERNSPYSPESNCRAERINRSLNDMESTMPCNAQVVTGWETIWAEAVRTAKVS